MILYSDGLIERKNQRGEPFEMERLINFVREKKHLSSAEILNSVIDEAYRFGNKVKWVDDVTVVVIKKLL